MLCLCDSFLYFEHSDECIDFTMMRFLVENQIYLGILRGHNRKCSILFEIIEKKKKKYLIAQ